MMMVLPSFQRSCNWLADLQGVRVFREQEVPVTDFRAAVVSQAGAGQEASLGGVGDGH